MALPSVALSVRQPWAWAILHAGKDIENRSLGSIRAGRMGLGRIALHAAQGLTRDEYHWGVLKLAERGVECPSPASLSRRAIVGMVTVTEIVTETSSPWFGGEAGLRLADPEDIDPIPAVGALGYFTWERAGDLAPPLPWMLEASGPNGDGATANLFPDAPVQFRRAPRKPSRRKRP